MNEIYFFNITYNQVINIKQHFKLSLFSVEKKGILHLKLINRITQVI